MNRFDYVQYDNHSAHCQAEAKSIVKELERFINGIRSGEDGRAKSLAITSLEECYMWIGKAIRDDQILRGAQIFLQEERTNS